MREIRPSGSEGGARSSILVPTPIYSLVAILKEPQRRDIARLRDWHAASTELIP